MLGNVTDIINNVFGDGTPGAVAMNWFAMILIILGAAGAVFCVIRAGAIFISSKEFEKGEKERKQMNKKIGVLMCWAVIGALMAVLIPAIFGILDAIGIGKVIAGEI